MFRRPSFDSWIFLAILLVAVILRLYNFSDLSLGNDELSVLARVQYDSFTDLIELGVKPDVHPAGIQVFAYYWTCLFGESAFALRFPFLLAGLLSVYLLFQLGKKWFGVESALFATAAFASLQYAITLTVYARPYALVLCFVLAMTLCWHKFLFENGGRKYLVGYVIFASLCMYFHYFSFLVLGIVGLAGIFIAFAEKRKPYLIGLLVIGVLYLPHIPIFLHHLSMGGSGWIGKPEPDYIFSYLAYVFHFSTSLISFLILFILSSLFLFITRKSTSGNDRGGQFRWLSALFYIFPFLVGFLYSIWKAPVMHTGGLFFSFPFLLLFIFSFLPRLTKTIKIVALSAFLLLTTLSLIYERDHYELFYNRSAEEIVKEMELQEKRAGEGNTVYLLQVHDPYYADYYLAESDLPVEAYNLDSLQSIASLRRFLKNRTENYLSLGWLSRPLPPHFTSVVREFFPYLSHRKNYFISEHYLFSKEPVESDDSVYHSMADFESINPDWQPLDIFKQDSMVLHGQYSGFLSDNQVFGPTIHVDLGKMEIQEYQEIWIKCQVKLENANKDIQLVLQISGDQGEEIWRSSKLSTFVTEKDSWNTLHFTSRLQHLELGPGSHQLKAYLWNPEKVNAWFDDFEIRLEKGNPNLYGLVEPLYE